MGLLVPDVPALIIHLPHAELVFQPLLRIKAIYMRLWTVTRFLIMDIKLHFMSADIFSFLCTDSHRYHTGLCSVCLITLRYSCLFFPSSEYFRHPLAQPLRLSFRIYFSCTLKPMFSGWASCSILRSM